MYSIHLLNYSMINASLKELKDDKGEDLFDFGKFESSQENKLKCELITIDGILFPTKENQGHFRIYFAENLKKPKFKLSLDVKQGEIVKSVDKKDKKIEGKKNLIYPVLFIINPNIDSKTINGGNFKDKFRLVIDQNYDFTQEDNKSEIGKIQQKCQQKLTQSYIKYFQDNKNATIEDFIKNYDNTSNSKLYLIIIIPSVLIITGIIIFKKYNNTKQSNNKLDRNHE